MKPALLARFLSILVCLAGSACNHRLPAIKASEIHQTISFPGFTSTADATGISITEATIRATDVSWRVSVLGVSVITTAKDFTQKRERDEKP